MSALAFVNALLDGGRVRVPMPSAPRPAPPGDLELAVRELDRAARVDLAFAPPALDVAVAAWALTVLYGACQALVYRDIDAAAVREGLTRPCPAQGTPTASVCYSADLAFRYLPDVLALARGIAEDDPLVLGLVALAREWPLSSVGVRAAGGGDVSAFIGEPCLRQLYADRVIERGDLPRLNDPAVRDAVRETLGACPELAPKVAEAVAAAVDQGGARA